MTQSWLDEFETRLAQLEATARRGVSELREVFGQAASAAAVLAKDTQLTVFVVRDEKPVSQGGNATDESALLVERMTPAGRLEPVDPEEAAPLREVIGTGQSTTNEGDGWSISCVAVPVGERQKCVVQLKLRQALADNADLMSGLQAIGDILAGLLAGFLLTEYDRRLQGQTRLIHLLTTLESADSMAAAADIIAQDGAAVLGECRISVLADRGGEPAVLAATGVREPAGDAQTITCLRAIFQKLPPDNWYAPEEAAERTGVEFVRHLTLQNTRLLRVFQFHASADQPPVAGLVVEVQLRDQVPDEGLLQGVVQAAGASLLHHRRSEFGWPARVLARVRSHWLAVTVVAVLVLVFWPAEFEVEVPGRIVSSSQRRLFAPEHGTIERVLFDNEHTVDAGAALLILANADLALELRRLDGLIATTDAELTATRARLLNDNDPEVSGREQRLVQQLQSVKQERELLEQRMNSLTVRAPFGGRVFRHSPQQELEQRPVQRGQLLLEIVPDDAQWNVELSIPDHLEGYVRQRVQQGESMPPVRYFARAVPGRSWGTYLTSLDQAVQVVDGKMICRARAEIGSFPKDELRPGVSVIARIDCGTRSLGFVWFRELIEVWQRIRFAWF